MVSTVQPEVVRICRAQRWNRILDRHVKGLVMWNDSIEWLG